MTFDATERSMQDGRPVELYRFTVGARVWRFTTDPEPFAFDNAAWLPAQITRGEIQDSTEMARGTLKVTVERTNAVAELYRLVPPSEVVRVSIFRAQRGVPGFETIFLGRALSATFDGPSAQLSCESVFSSLLRPGLRRTYQRTCPHLLYGPQCGVVEADFAEVVQLSQVSGARLEAPSLTSFGDGWFAGGMLEWEPGGVLPTERRAVIEYVGAGGIITLSHAIPGLAPGASVRLVAGCAHDMGDCLNKFNNLANYGGFAWIPLKNPFGGTSLY